MWLLGDDNPAANALRALYGRLEWAVDEMDAVLSRESSVPRLPAAALVGTVALALGSVLLFLVGLAWELVDWWRTITARRMVYSFMVLSTLVLAVTALDILRGERGADDEFIEE